jgi:hypothetical protein
MRDFYWCTAPNCASGQIHISGSDGPILICHACKGRSCIVHNITWHEGETCNEYTYRMSPRRKRAEERASERLVKQIAKSCPGPGCGARIQKNEGCDHMTCELTHANPGEGTLTKNFQVGHVAMSSVGNVWPHTRELEGEETLHIRLPVNTIHSILLMWYKDVVGEGEDL